MPTRPPKRCSQGHVWQPSATVTRCPICANRRGTTTTERGYGSKHQALRELWRARIDLAGNVECAAPTCKREQAGGSRLIRPGEPFDLGHAVDRRRYLGPMHPACNRATRRPEDDR